eukprot:7871791-Pyramimonas_sp.AAC.1
MRAVPQLSGAVSVATANIDAKLDDCWGNSPGYGPCEPSKTALQCGGLLGGRHVACGHIDPVAYLADELAKWYLAGKIPVGASRSSVVSAPHMSHRTSKSDPYEPKYNNPNPMAS